MKIMSSADIRQRYNDVVSQCRDSGEPVYLTKNGQGELVVMDIDSFEKREQELRPLRHINDSFQKIIIVWDNVPRYQNNDGVLFINIYDFLCSEL